MGDPHSPGMAIGTCAWMENEWMQTLDTHTRQHFAAKRYMDDIILLYITNPRFQVEQFLHDFQSSECYWPPLKLEDGATDTFLETTFIIEDNNIRHKLKNVNEDDIKVWRYAHYNSNNRYTYKKATLLASLRKVHFMASDDIMLIGSALEKIREFVLLSYPKRMLHATCTKMGVLTRNATWFVIRQLAMRFFA